jgi:hypothetical protein
MKMKKVRYMKGAMAIVLALQVAAFAVAGEKVETPSPASIELLKARALWFHSGNGAGLTLDQLENFGSLNAAYNHTTGPFKRVQEGVKVSHLGISTEGGVKLGEGYAWGEFGYDNVTDKETRYNTAMLNPFRGVPYFPVDPNVSDWKKQYYDLRMKAASKPLFGRYLLGIQAEYRTHTGAKQVDPRSEPTYYAVNVKPGIAASFGSHRVGINMEYENAIQEGRHTNSNSQLHQDVFVMKGLGNHYTAVIGGLQSLGAFQYTSNKLGGELQYGLRFSGVNLLLNGGYTFRVEDAIRDISKPRKEGTFRDESLYANLAAVIEGADMHRVNLSYRKDNQSGIEYVQVLDQTYEVQQWVDLYSSIRSTYARDDFGLSYDFYRGAAHEYRWKAGATVNYRSNDDRYIMPASSMKIQNLYLGVNGKVNIAAGRLSKFMLGADFLYKKNLNGEYLYGGADPESIVITEFMIPDVAYLKQDYYKIGGSATFVTGIAPKAGLYVSAVADYYKPVDGDDHRFTTTLGLGFTF